MWPRNLRLSWLLILLWGLASGPALADEVSGTITGTSQWQGEVRLNGPVTVAADAVLTIAAGTTVRPLQVTDKLVVKGQLLVVGTARAPVRFAAPPGWQGLEFFEGAPGSRLEHLHVEGAQVAIATQATTFVVRNGVFRQCGTAIKLLRESSPVLEHCEFADNQIGIDNEMKSRPTIRNCRFTGHTQTAILASHNSGGPIQDNTFEDNKQAIGFLQKYPDRISGNRFLDNAVAIFCNQTQDSPEIRDNRFERNEAALVNGSFSCPLLENNVFMDNGTAVRNDQFGSPQVRQNLFRGNRLGIYNYRKSNPVVEQNQFDGNDLALYCDYASYPRVKNNNFTGNKMAVKLGIFQSVEWEKRFGSATMIQRQAQARSGKTPQRGPGEGSVSNEYVDVRGNWWGEDTPRLTTGGQGNVAIFFDRQDQATVSYEGFGPERYALDEVRYTPWLTGPVPAAGPLAAP